MNVRHNSALTGHGYEKCRSMTDDRIFADDVSHQTNVVEPPKGVGLNKAAPMLGGDSDFNEPVVPVTELRLLAKTRERNSSTGERARFRLFVAALLVIGLGVAAARYLYPEESGAQTVKAVTPQQPVFQSPAPQTAEVAQPKTEMLSHKSTELATAANSAELLNQRLETVVHDLTAVQSSVQQLVAKQEEITRNIAELQKGKNLRPALLPQPSRRAVVRTTNAPPNKLPLQPASNVDEQQPPTSTVSRDLRTQVSRPPLAVQRD
jgi:hypothetical protein